MNRKKGIVISNGRRRPGVRSVWEAMNFAAMDQFKVLWEEEYRGGLPIIFNFFNNHYGMGGQTSGETMGFGMLARLGAGINPEQMHAERIDGYNPLAVIDAIKRKKKLLEEGKGPVLLDTITYRFTGHSPSDSSSYRTKEEIEAWMKHDPLICYRNELIKAGIAGDETFESILEDTRELVTKICRLATDDSISPRMDPVKDPDAIGKYMFSDLKLKRWMTGNAKTHAQGGQPQGAAN